MKTTTRERVSIPRDPAALEPAIHPCDMLLEELRKLAARRVSEAQGR